MATRPFYSPIPSSIALTKNTINVSSKPYLSSSSSLRSSSLAIKCSKNNGNVRGNHCSVRANWLNDLKRVKLDKFVSNLADPMGIAKREVDQLRSENKKLKQQLIHLTIKVDELNHVQTENKNMKEYIDHVIKTKVDQVRTENEKMTQHIDYLKTKVDEIEKCEKKVLEAQVLLAELECSLQVIKQALRNEY